MDRDQVLAAATSHLRRRKWWLAADILTEALKDQPDWSEGHAILAQCRNMAGVGEAAVAELRRAIELQPDRFDLRVAMVEELRYIDTGRAVAAAREAIAHAPDSPFYVGELAYTIIPLGLIHEALALYRRAARLEPRVLKWQLGIVDTLFWYLHDKEAAADALREAEHLMEVDLGRDNCQAEYEIGLRFQRLGLLEPALKYLERAYWTSQSSDDVEGAFVKALVLTGHLDRAVQACDDALDGKRPLYSVGMDLAEFLAYDGRQNDAARLYQRIADDCPEHYRHWRCRALLRLSEIQRTQGDTEASLRSLALAVEAAPQDSEAGFQYGEALEAAGHVAAARQQWSRVVDLGNEDWSQKARWKLETTGGSSGRDADCSSGDEPA